MTHSIKIIPVEVKSSNVKRHKSLDVFTEKYSGIIEKSFLVLQHDIGKDGIVSL